MLSETKLFLKNIRRRAVKEKLPVNFLRDVIFPLVFGIFIILGISIDAYSKGGLGPALVYAAVFGLIVAGLCCLSFVGQINHKGGGDLV
jgi:lipopolysaccharide export LptBFGC system permease protein LptF